MAHTPQNLILNFHINYSCLSVYWRHGEGSHSDSAVRMIVRMKKCFSGMVWSEFYMQKIKIHERYCNECQSLFKVHIGGDTPVARGDTDKKRKSYSSEEGRMLFKRRDEESKKGWICGWFYEKREGT